MSVAPYLLKQDPEIPDFYGISITYHDGTTQKFEGFHRIIADMGIMDVCTKDDEWHTIPLTSIKFSSFDKRFSKYLACQEKARKAGV